MGCCVSGADPLKPKPRTLLAPGSHPGPGHDSMSRASSCSDGPAEPNQRRSTSHSMTRSPRPASLQGFVCLPRPQCEESLGSSSGARSLRGRSPRTASQQWGSQCSHNALASPQSSRLGSRVGSSGRTYSVHSGLDPVPSPAATADTPMDPVLEDRDDGRAAVRRRCSMTTGEVRQLAQSGMAARFARNRLQREEEARLAGLRHPHTAAAVAQHSTEDDCWVVVRGRIFDVTTILPDHPGGPHVLLRHGGGDATALFEEIHEDNPDVIAALQQCYVADLHFPPP